ncbi:DNA polymerase III subunit gamma/tau [bacterium]|nr:DNA polymerase III subunit gamma/tau [bacterium]MBU1635500.1 DNA polymerase III subunit gamma/tau [bacterium]MBU1873789.1 DNA polymerase III subunit gamma/tau [bacterium]
MSYQVISRKYRPQRFDEVIGQSHICLTLQNAIKSNRISHAYLFTGSRGIGKTSTARIFAKSMNCLNPQGIDPCNECRNCIEITGGRSMDVLEIDGASNRGIDQIRELRENVKYPPSNSKNRIFIIDEVHMLTKEAFNALLKTLEEPPSHVIFIFATTEPLKIPATIISRCQRYDFHRIPIREIVRHLGSIAQNEHVEITDDILMLVAKKAEGGMRDAESLLDQLIAFSDQSVSLEEAKNILSLIDYEYYIDISNKVLENDTGSLLQVAGSVIDDGINLTEFFTGFSEHFRNLLIASATGSVDMLDLPDNMKQRYGEEAQKWDAADLLRLIKLLTDAQAGLRTSINHRMHIEFTLLRMGAMHKTVTIEDILESLKNPEYRPAANIVKETLSLFNAKKPVKKSEPSVERTTESPEMPIPTQQTELKETENVNNTPADSQEITVDIQQIKEQWFAITEKVAETNPSLASFLNMGRPEEINGNSLTVMFRNGASFHLNNIRSKAPVVENCIEKIIGKYLKIKCIEDKIEDHVSEKENILNKMTKKVIDIFGGEIIPT